MINLFTLVRDANPARKASNLNRRCLKILEELGEIAEAFLNVTSSSNGKGKTWDDVREEIVDVLIVGMDIALTDLEDGLGDVFYDDRSYPIRSELTPYEQGEDAVFSIAYHVAAFMKNRKAAERAVSRAHAKLVVKYATDLAYMALPDQADASFENIRDAVQKEMVRKIAKWDAKRAKMEVVTDDV